MTQMDGGFDRFLRPAGGGIHTVSTGKSAQAALQRAIYGAASAEEVDAKWREALARVASARVAVLGIPSDTGAGLVRGAAFGPEGVRRALLGLRPDYGARAARAGIVDIGDVFVVPQLLTDDMLSAEQLARSRAALYGEAAAKDGKLPVAPLSVAERVVDLLLAQNPGLRVFALGGDHSVAWPVVAAIARHTTEPWGIVQLDAHTDLLAERLGVRVCFATWAYHANELVGRGGRLVQIGVRASSRDKRHWESTLGVRQFWAEEVRARGEAVIEDVIAHLAALGVRRVYLSNDIDATDSGVEVAPPVGAAEDARRTAELAASYMLTSLAALAETPGLWDGPER